LRVAFIGCVEFSYNALQHLLRLPDSQVVGVASRASSTFNADFRSLRPLAELHGLSYLEVRGNDQAPLAGWLSGLDPDVVYCFGWAYLLRPEVLAIPRLGCIGYHPSALPRNRGRHPIIWALALGLTQTAATFFFMDQGADSGDILSQETVAILPDDDARTLYDKLTDTAQRQIELFTRQLAAGRFPRLPQEPRLATSWRRRTSRDGEIDWRMSANSIHNLVRALTRPYVGAHCLAAGLEVKVWKTALVDSRGMPRDVEPGKILDVSAGSLVIQCGEGALEVVEHAFPALPKVGSYLSGW
jgi:methionyl-tRNA formyltransferase